jgi:hypothetical protein
MSVNSRSSCDMLSAKRLKSSAYTYSVPDDSDDNNVFPPPPSGGMIKPRRYAVPLKHKRRGSSVTNNDMHVEPSLSDNDDEEVTSSTTSNCGFNTTIGFQDLISPFTGTNLIITGFNRPFITMPFDTVPYYELNPIKSWTYIPDLCIAGIGMYVDFHTLLLLLQVNKHWKSRLVLSKSAWSHRCIDIFQPTTAYKERWGFIPLLMASTSPPPSPIPEKDYYTNAIGTTVLQFQTQANKIRTYPDYYKTRITKVRFPNYPGIDITSLQEYVNLSTIIVGKTNRYLNNNQYFTMVRKIDVEICPQLLLLGVGTSLATNLKVLDITNFVGASTFDTIHAIAVTFPNLEVLTTNISDSSMAKVPLPGFNLRRLSIIGYHPIDSAYFSLLTQLQDLQLNTAIKQTCPWPASLTSLKANYGSQDLDFYIESMRFLDTFNIRCTTPIAMSDLDLENSCKDRFLQVLASSHLKTLKLYKFGGRDWFSNLDAIPIISTVETLCLECNDWSKIKDHVNRVNYPNLKVLSLNGIFDNTDLKFIGSLQWPANLHICYQGGKISHVGIRYLRDMISSIILHLEGSIFCRKKELQVITHRVDSQLCYLRRHGRHRSEQVFKWILLPL